MATPTAPNPRACLAGLPNELKAQIVQLVAWGNANYRARIEEAINSEDQGGDEGDVYVDGYDETLSSLSLVSKEFNAFVAPHLFACLQAERGLNPVFRYSVIKRHASYITSVSFSSHGSPAHDHTLSHLFLFPNLRRIEMASDLPMLRALGGTFFEREEPPSDLGFAEAAFRAAAARVTTLELGEELGIGWTPQAVRIALKAFPSLTRLKLRGQSSNDHRAFDHGRLEDTLPYALQACKHLQHLELESPQTGTQLNSSWYTPSWSSPTPITFFRLATSDLSIHDWGLVSALAPGLTTLQLFFEEIEDELLESLGNDTSVFPLVKVLVLDGRVNDSTQSLPSHFPAAVDLTYCLALNRVDSSLGLFHHLAAPHSTVRRLTIPSHREAGDEALNARALHTLVAFCDAHGIITSTTSSLYPFTRKSDYLSDPPPSIEAAGRVLDSAAARRTLDFGVAQVERARLDGDQERLSQTLVALESLERIRRAWEDLDDV